VLWNGFAGPGPDTLLDFSCPALPLRKPISPSLSSSFFLRPQILHATTNKPARTMAPPTPTTTPMTVLFVFGDMLEDEVSFEESAAVPVAFDEEVVSVDDEREVMTLPETVVITVTTPTLAGVLVECVGVEVGVGVSELEVESSLVLDELLGVGLELDDVAVVGVGVLDDVLLADVLFTVADAEEEVESVTAVPDPNNPPTRLVATELMSERTAFFSIFTTSRRWKRFESSQLA
jgi:hypothetical protein